MKRRELGKRGEEIAAEYLQKNGYTIIGRNIYSRFGEIDILAKFGQELIFVEVKTRAFFPELEIDRIVSFKKYQRIRRAALTYLEKLDAVLNWRCDLIFVIFSHDSHSLIHTILRNFDTPAS